MQAVDGVYTIPQEHLDFRDTIRAIVQDKVAPRAAEIDETGDCPWDVRQLLADQDILGLPFEEEHGGTGTGTLMLQMAVEEIAKASPRTPRWTSPSTRCRSSAATATSPTTPSSA